MLPSVTRSHPLSSQGADHAPCPAGAFSRGSWALSAAPDSGCSPAHPTHASAKDAHLCPPGFSPACQCPPDCLHWNGPRRPRQHISELAAFLPDEPRPLLCSPPQGAASSPARLPTAQARCPLTSIRGAPVPPVWPPEVLSLLHPPWGCGPRTAHDCPPVDSAHFLLSHHSHGHSARWSPGIFLEMQIGSCYSPARNCPSEKTNPPGRIPQDPLLAASFFSTNFCCFPILHCPLQSDSAAPCSSIACSLPAFNLKHACAGSSPFHSLPVAEKSLPPVTCLDL